MIRVHGVIMLTGSILITLVMGAGLDTQPEGPPVEAVRASGIGARVTPAQEKGSFLVRFPAGHPKPAAVFSFKETNVNERMGMALDIKNNGTGPVRIFADLNENKWVRGYVTAPAGKTVTLYVFERRKALAADDVKMFPGMPPGIATWSASTSISSHWTMWSCPRAPISRSSSGNSTWAPWIAACSIPGCAAC